MLLLSVINAARFGEVTYETVFFSQWDTPLIAEGGVY